MALEYILEAIAIERENGDRGRLAIRLGLASDICLKMGDCDNALKYVEEAYRIDSEDGREVKAAIRPSIIGLNPKLRDDGNMRAVAIFSTKHRHFVEKICLRSSFSIKTGFFMEKISIFTDG